VLQEVVLRVCADVARQHLHEFFGQGVDCAFRRPAIGAGDGEQDLGLGFITTMLP